jgi:hypothetical protein
VNGLLLVVAGVLIFSIGWSVRSLATFIGALFIFGGVSLALTAGIDARVRQVNAVTALLSIAAGVAIIVWPGPGLVAVADPGATLAALVTVGGIWAVAVGVMRIIVSFEVKRLPKDVDQAFAERTANAAGQTTTADAGRTAPTPG